MYISSQDLIEQKKDINEDWNYWLTRVSDLRYKHDSLLRTLLSYSSYCETNSLRKDRYAIRSLKFVDSKLKKLIQNSAKLNYEVDGSEKYSASSISFYNRLITERNQLYRSALHFIMMGNMLLDWRSQSYAQSVDTMFFNPKYQMENGQVNYSRYESFETKRVEEMLQGLYDLDTDRQAIFATSSGMSAFLVLFDLLLQEILHEDDIVYIPRYVYFEAEQEIRKTRNMRIRIVREEESDPHAIIEKITLLQPKLVVLDPLTNNLDLRLLDIEHIISEVDRRLKRPVYLLTDGTMVSGQIKLGRIVRNYKNVRLFYYESCSKYLQLGLDMFMGGFGVVPKEYEKEALLIRRNTGSIMYDYVAEIFPEYDRDTFVKIMNRFDRNARLICEVINNGAAQKYVVPVHPRMPYHPDFKAAQGYESVGGIVTFRFHEGKYNNRGFYNVVMKTCIELAKKYKISLTKGVSFGFSMPRISAAAAMAETTEPFLRLSVGNRSYLETKLLGHILAESIVEAVKSSY